MNDKQENKLTMFEAVVNLLDSNTAKIASLTALTDLLTDFKDRVAEIKEKDLLANTAKTGNATAKASDRTALTEDAITIAAALFALGSATDDDRLKELAAYNKSKFKSLRDTQLAIDVTNIKNLADANAAQLTSYGITAPMIAALDTKLTAFNASMGARETGADVSTAAFGQLELKFKEADTLLKEQMDKIMEVFRNSDPQFYNEYKNSREIADLGVRHREEETPEEPVNP
jgi:hypothetical protein